MNIIRQRGNDLEEVEVINIVKRRMKDDSNSFKIRFDLL